MLCLLPSHKPRLGVHATMLCLLPSYKLRLEVHTIMLCPLPSYKPRLEVHAMLLCLQAKTTTSPTCGITQAGQERPALAKYGVEFRGPAQR